MISTPVNAEITEYHEKFFAGLSIRQLVCVGIALPLAVGTGIVGHFCGFSIDILGYFIMLAVTPFLALGWLRFKGYTFEKYAAIWLAWNIQEQRLPIRNMKQEVYHAIRQNKKSIGRAEFCCGYSNKKIGTKIARKEAQTAKSEIRKIQRKIRKESRAAARAQKRGGMHRLSKDV
jgi:hypothetical protein